MRPVTSQIMNKLAVNANQSAVIYATDIVRFSIQAVATGTPNGTLQLRFSNDKPVGVNPASFVPTNWTNLGSSVAVAAAGTFSVPAAASAPWFNAVESAYAYLQLVYTDSSGGTAVGTISANIEVKSL